MCFDLFIISGISSYAYKTVTVLVRHTVYTYSTFTYIFVLVLYINTYKLC